MAHLHIMIAAAEGSQKSILITKYLKKLNSDSLQVK